MSLQGALQTRVRFIKGSSEAFLLCDYSPIWALLNLEVDSLSSEQRLGQRKSEG